MSWVWSKIWTAAVINSIYINEGGIRQREIGRVLTLVKYLSVRMCTHDPRVSAGRATGSTSGTGMIHLD